MGASAKLGGDEFPIRGGQASDHPSRGQANIGTIEIRAYAGHLLGDALLAQTCIGAGIAGFRAGIAGGDALSRAGVVGVGFEGMRLKHLLDVTHEISFGFRGELARGGKPARQAFGLRTTFTQASCLLQKMS